MKNKIVNISFNSIIGFSICIILGLIFFGTNIFNFYSHALQITSFGLVGAIFFSFYKYGTKKEAGFVGGLLFIINLILLGKKPLLIYYLRDLVFFICIYSSLILYLFFLKKYSYSLLFIRALALSLFLGVFNIFATILLVLLTTSPNIDPLSAIFINARYASLIGLGLGIGFDLFEKFREKILRFSVLN